MTATGSRTGLKVSRSMRSSVFRAWTLIATDLDPKALQHGLTRDELAAALKGHVKDSAGLVTRFKHP